MKILLTGITGQVGQALAKVLTKHELITPERSQLDLSYPHSISDFVEGLRPDLIINPAAYTGVDKAENEPDMARRINTEAPRALAQAAARHGIGLIHFSTDYVFDGNKPAPYDERDTPSPLNVYGQSKLDGERAVATACDAFWILRCSWIYSAEGNNFIKTILRLAQERESLNIVDDQWGAPTWSESIAEAVAAMIGSDDDHDKLTQHIRETAGIYNVCAQGTTNWHDYARRIVAAMPMLGLQARLNIDDISAISSQAYPTPAIRPLNSRLLTDKLERTFGVHLPAWENALDQCLEKIATMSKPDDVRQ